MCVCCVCVCVCEYSRFRESRATEQRLVEGGGSMGQESLRVFLVASQAIERLEATRFTRV